MFANSIAPSTLSLDSLASSFSTSYAGVVAFVAVAAEGSFAKAGDRLGIGRSAVSRNVRKLEIQLGTRLFLRTTRSTSLTREGECFFEKCHAGVEQIVQALEEMRDLREGPPRGQLRVMASSAFGRRVVMPVIGGFRSRYPGIAIELFLSERPVEFISDRVDVAFQEGCLEDSQLVARQVIPMQLLVCASPEYVHVHGLPSSIEEIAGHQCVRQRLSSGRILEWEFKVNGHASKRMPESTCTLNDPELVLQAVLDGQGMAQLPGFLVSEHLRTGRLMVCLGQHQPDDRGHYVCYLSRHQLPTRIRVFIDYMTERIRERDQQGLTLQAEIHPHSHLKAGSVLPARSVGLGPRVLKGAADEAAGLRSA